MVSNCGAGEDSRVPWTARRSNRLILKEGLMLKLQYFGHLVNSLEETLILGKIEGRRRRGDRMRRLDVITDSLDMSWSKFREMVKDREAWRVAVHGVAKSGLLLSI